MRSCSLVLSLAVILLMLVTMSSFAIAACSASACCSASPYCSAPACSAPAYCSAPACSAETSHTCDPNCIYRQPTQAEQKMAQVALVGIRDPFPTAWTVHQMMDTMERIMEDPCAYPTMREEGGGGYMRGRTPWKIIEDKEHYKMRLDMPGMTKDDVSVSVEGKMLVVKPKKPAKVEEEWSPKNYWRCSSRIELPENIEKGDEKENYKVKVTDGVLYITIPKAKTSSEGINLKVE